MLSKAAFIKTFPLASSLKPSITVSNAARKLPALLDVSRPKNLPEREISHLDRTNFSLRRCVLKQFKETNRLASRVTLFTLSAV